jgi:hypothetical protein
MLKVVEDESAIRRHQRQFIRALRPLAEETIPVKLGHPGASVRARVSWSGRLGIWFFSRKIGALRYWHAFGIGRPEGGANIPITCEINFPLCGIDRRTGGAFADDPAGRVFVVHRGKLGGGRKGIGKSLFENRYRGVWEVMDDGGTATPVALVGALHSPRFARQIAQFVRKIARIKKEAAARSSQIEIGFGEPGFREELVGAPYGEPEREIGAECDRGLVIRDLADALRGRDLRTGNDDRRDMVALDRNGRLRAIFEVGTELTLSGLHAGAARLLLNALDLPDTPRLVLVLPCAPENQLREQLARLKIDLLTFGWEGDRAVFPGLPLLFPGSHPDRRSAVGPESGETGMR